jgi:putative cell wall-binding protein
VRFVGRYRVIMSRLLAALVLCAVFALPLSAGADDTNATSARSQASVSIEIPGSTLANPDAWAKPPVIAQLIPQGAGVVWYRFGAAPGPWQRSLGYIVVPAGKQTLSALLIAPDGSAGPISQAVVRSDVHASGLTASASSLLGAAPAGSRTATYVGEPQVEGAVTVNVVVGPKQLGTVVRRLQGTNRFGTSAAISSSAFKSAHTVILATGEKFPDALTASGLAGAIKAPVLLLHRTSIPPETKAEIRRLGAKHAIICGGPPAVDNNTAGRLRAMGLSVERLSGKTRYETAIAVSQRIQKLTGNTNRVFIVRGDRFVDALVISPLAYATRSPILLTSIRTMWPTTAKRLSAGRYKSAVVVGGSMSASTLGSIKNRLGVAPEVWAGSGASDTSVQVAAREVLDGALSWKYVGLARSDIFPDALCGGAVAGKQGGVILLTPPTSLDAGVANALTAHTADIARCEIYGSRFAISNGVMGQVQAIFR